MDVAELSEVVRVLLTTFGPPWTSLALPYPFYAEGVLNLMQINRTFYFRQ